MKIAVVYGTMHKGSTYHCVKLFLESLSSGISLSDGDVSEFFLPRDMSDYCRGCYSCFMKGEQNCPHAGKVQPIEEELENADLIILASPAYVYDVSGQMKTFLDHLGYRWMVHRPAPSMFGKLGLVVSTAAGAGQRRTDDTMKKSLKYWGVRRIYSFGSAVGAMNWDGVKPDKKQKLEKRLNKLGKKIAAAYKSKNNKPPLFTRFMFSLMKGMQKGNDWNPADRNYWQQQGWLDGKKNHGERRGKIWAQILQILLIICLINSQSG